MSSSEGTKESFFKLLKAVCKSCKKASLKTYHQNIKRLYRLIKPEATHVPTEHIYVYNNIPMAPGTRF